MDNKIFPAGAIAADAPAPVPLFSVPGSCPDSLAASFATSYAGVVAFIAVAAQGSFAKAGDRLGIGRSAVSRSVQTRGWRGSYAMEITVLPARHQYAETRGANQRCTSAAATRASLSGLRSTRTRTMR